MPDRELRHMRRTELVEIILALKQSEDSSGQKTLPCLPSCRNGRSILKTQVPLRRLHWS